MFLTKTDERRQTNERECECKFKFKGSLSLIFGPMFSGKSTELLRRIRRFTVARRKCLVIKYLEDEIRCGSSDVTTHDRDTWKAVSCLSLSEIEKSVIDDVQVVGIDEGQFFKDVVYFCEKWANEGKVVIVAALDGTFQRKPFGSILELVPKADEVLKLNSVCKCTEPAIFSRRLDASSLELKDIGGPDKYVAECRTCYLNHVKESDGRKCDDDDNDGNDDKDIRDDLVEKNLRGDFSLRNAEVKMKVTDEDFNSALLLLSMTYGKSKLKLNQRDVFYLHPKSFRLKIRFFDDDYDDDCDRADVILYERSDSNVVRESSYDKSTIVGVENVRNMHRTLEKTFERAGTVKNKRIVFIVSETRIHFDDVEGLGKFVELEAVLAPEESVESGIARVNELIEHLKLENGIKMYEAYVDMLSKKKETSSKKEELGEFL